MPSRKFLNVPPGSILHYWVRVVPPDCANLNLDISVDGVRNPPQVSVSGTPVAPPLTTPQLANRSPEPFFGPVEAGGSLILDLTMVFLAAGTVAVVPTLEEPEGGVQTREPLAFAGDVGQIQSASVSVRA